jgi:hypothetical protein
VGEIEIVASVEHGRESANLAGYSQRQKVSLGKGPAADAKLTPNTFAGMFYVAE